MNTEQKCRTTYIEGFMNVYIGGYRKTYSHDNYRNVSKEGNTKIEINQLRISIKNIQKSCIVAL